MSFFIVWLVLVISWIIAKKSCIFCFFYASNLCLVLPNASSDEFWSFNFNTKLNKKKTERGKLQLFDVQCSTSMKSSLCEDVNTSNRHLAKKIDTQRKKKELKVNLIREQLHWFIHSTNHHSRKTSNLRLTCCWLWLNSRWLNIAFKWMLIDVEKLSERLSNKEIFLRESLSYFDRLDAEIILSEHDLIDNFSYCSFAEQGQQAKLMGTNNICNEEGWMSAERERKATATEFYQITKMRSNFNGHIKTLLVCVCMCRSLLGRIPNEKGTRGSQIK